MASATPKVGHHLPSTSTLEWHPAMAHLAMAPSNGNTSTAPSNGTTSTLKVGRHPSSTPHWHPAMAPPPPPTIAHYNGTLQWHPAMAPRPLPQSWSLPSPRPTTLHHVNSPKVGRHPPPQPQYTTMAPYDGTQQWHHVHCTLQWHPGATSNPPKWFVALPPIGSKNPYSYRYLGNNGTPKSSILIWFSIIFIIHFGVPLFLETPT